MKTIGLLGGMSPESTVEYYRTINDTVRRRLGGAQGIVLGCTEIPMLIRQEDSPLPLFDTLALHARKAVDWALA